MEVLKETAKMNICCPLSSSLLLDSGKAGKAIPIQAWTGPEGSRTLRFPDFKTIGT